MWNTPTTDQLKSIPGLYETEHVALQDKVIHLHFFIGGSDWYIAEYDGETLFWGYAILNGDLHCAEWGYISFTELRDIRIPPGIEIDTDIHWSPRPAAEVEKICKGMGWPLPSERQQASA